MNDRFMNALKKEPRAEFARALGEKLRRSVRAEETRRRSKGWQGAWRLNPAWAAAMGLAVAITALVLFPSVRASAQAFLSLFRVRNFVAVPIDRARVEILQKRASNGLFSLFGDARMSHDEAPRAFSSAAEAYAAAGMVGREPTYLPPGMTADSAYVLGEHSMEGRIDARKANDTFAALGIADLTLPPELDGASFGARVPRAVGVRYKQKGIETFLLQAPQPEVSLPPGVDLARLGEMGLRVAGLDAAEARRFAANVDWNSTLLVPVPPDANVIREVEVNGRRALLVETDERDDRPGAHPGRRGQRATVLWSDDERVFALTGNLESVQLVAMANSVR